MDIALTQIAEWLETPAPGGNSTATGYVIDSRRVRPGDLFFALPGERHDGHEFVETALAAGAASAVVSASAAAGQPWANRSIAVADVGEALIRLARRARQQWGQRVVAITGSNGKTTTKELTATLLATRFRTAKSEGNFNNRIGLPLSILHTPSDAQAAVWEMGMNHTGELTELAQIAAPNIGLVTNVSGAHLGHFASVDEIGLAKRELIEGLVHGGVAVLNADDERVNAFAKIHHGPVVTFGIENEAASLRAAGVLTSDAGSRFTLLAHGDGQASAVAFECPLPGRHNVYNVLAALAVCSLFRIPLESLVDTVDGLRPVGMRGEWIELDGARLLNDTYNANPASMRAMLQVLAATAAHRRIAVLGEMREMGEHSLGEHRALGAAAVRAGVDLLVCVGHDAKPMADGWIAEGASSAGVIQLPNAEAAGGWLHENVSEGDAVLLKASRGIGLEKAIARLREQRAAKTAVTAAERR